MVEVLLVSVNRENRPHPVYPLALDFLHAVCASIGFTVATYDCNMAHRESETLADRLKRLSPRFVLLSIRNIDNNESVNTTYYLSWVVEAVNTVRAHSKACVVLGGSGFSLFPREILAVSGADCGLVGSCESSLKELLLALDKGAGLGSIPGAVYLDQAPGGVVVNPARMDEQFTIPPGRNVQLLRWYWESGGVSNIRIKRGCPFSCVYCCYPLLDGKRIVTADVADAVDRIECDYRTVGVDRFFIVDSVFNLTSNYVEAFARELLLRALPIKWTAFFSPMKFTGTQAELLKASGLESLEFGVDTLASSLIPRYRKHFSVNDVLAAAAACSKVRLPYAIFLIFGGPGETVDTVAESIAVASKLVDGVFFAFIGMRVYPGTELHQLACDEGQVDPADNLLEPKFYLSRELDAERFNKQMAELRANSRWFVAGSSLEDGARVASALQRRGKLKGSLWQLASPCI